MEVADEFENNSYSTTETSACNWLLQLKKNLDISAPMIPAGINVDFDLKFLAKRMPLLFSLFSYIKYDLSTLRLATDFRPNYQQIAKEFQHRALYDLYLSINENKNYKVSKEIIGF